MDALGCQCAQRAFCTQLHPTGASSARTQSKSGAASALACAQADGLGLQSLSAASFPAYQFPYLNDSARAGCIALHAAHIHHLTIVMPNHRIAAIFYGFQQIVGIWSLAMLLQTCQTSRHALF